MIGAIGKSAHISGADIQEVRAFQAAVSDTRPHTMSVALDQEHLDMRLLEEIEREHGS